MQGGKGANWFGMPGGRLSLGRYEEGSGYCVGAVVETGMGVRSGRKAKGEVNVGDLAGNGMRDVWVIGEGFFRGVGGVFDVGFSCGQLRRVSLRRHLVSRAKGWFPNLLNSHSTPCDGMMNEV